MAGSATPDDENAFYGKSCLVAYLIVERERVDQRLTWRKLKRQLILKGPQTSLPSLEQLRMAA
jgi:hypothetical protein